MANLRVNKITSTETFEKTGSVQFDGNADYLNIADSDDLDFGSEDFTIECWILPIGDNNGGTNFSIFYNKGVDLQCYWRDNLNRIEVYADSNGGTDYDILNTLNTPTGSVNRGVWTHVAIVRSGNTFQIYLNGKASGSPKTSSSAIGSNSTDATIGDYKPDLTKYEFNGHISNVRVLKGVALYTKNFKPPMKELEVIPGTVLLACQSKTDATLEKTGKTITVVNNAVPCDLTPGLLRPIVKSGGGSAIKGSVEFNLNGDGLVLPKSTDFAFGTGNFTIEGWFNVSDTGDIRTIFDSRTSDNNSTGIFVGINSNDNLYTYGFPSGTGVVNYGIPKHGEWHHFAVVRQGFTGFVFLNGIKISESINTGSTNYTDQGATIGQPSTVFAPTLYRYKGFLSNIRVNKGTALYTSDFTPPARELKNIPGTVLLCCQDPDNPFTEATGKTLNGEGVYQRSNGIEYITNGSFVGGYTTEWEAKNSATISHDATNNTGRVTVTSTTNYSGIRVKSAYLPSLVAGREYAMTIDLVSITNPIRFGVVSGNTLSNIDSAGKHTLVFTAGTSTTEIFIEKPDGSNSTFVIDYVSITEIDGSHPSSNYTPQVGDDKKVTFEGVTKVDTNAYFYLPTGDTLSREATGSYNAGTRGLFGGGLEPGVSQDEIQFINIATLGDAKDFGNLTEDRWGNGACASDTRALWGAGLSAGPNQYYNVIDYVTIMTKGDAKDFGDLTYGVPYYTGAVSNTTRGIWGGGYNTPSSPLVPSPFPNGFQNEMEYITIASKGNGIDFGDFAAKNSMSTFGSPTRGCFAGGATPTRVNTIEYITIASTGDAQDFGDLIAPINYGGGCSNSIRAIVFGGYNGAADANTNVISYNTIASMGNAQDFGDLTTEKSELGACSSATRGVVGGGWSPVKIDEMDYVTIATQGNAQAFGELINVGVYAECGTSNGHGGLG